MKVEKHHFIANNGFTLPQSELRDKANLVLYFGGRHALEDGALYHTLKKTYPHSILIGCSTGGEIVDNDIYEDSAVSIAVNFKKTPIRKASYAIDSSSESFGIGEKIGEDLKADDLKGVFLLSDGLHVNGSALVKGILSQVGERIAIMGGLAGDGADFKTTLVGGDHPPCEKQVVAVGFYGEHIRFGHGSEGGWSPFGPERLITKSESNILYELDGKPALEIYKSYLGKRAAELPASALLFPLSITSPDTPDVSVIRTILSIDEYEQSMTFAGNVPEGHIAKLMHSTSKHLIEGAQSAGEAARRGVSDTSDSVAILISCIGRKLIMGPRIIDEIDAVCGVLGGDSCVKVGFFSYGEISPGTYSGFSELQNQTMTVMTFTEDC